MAVAFFNEYTSDRHRGLSAGSQPAESVNPNAVKAMEEVGIDISDVKPKRLTADLVEEADIVRARGYAPLSQPEMREPQLTHVCLPLPTSPLYIPQHLNGQKKKTLNLSHGGDDAGPITVRRKEKKVGRNAPCPCGSGKKYKKCCGAGK